VITLATVHKLALAMEGVDEKPHFEKTSFRVGNRIFATVDAKEGTVVLKLSEIDQSVFSNGKNSAFYPVPGPWGRKGWTIVELKKVRKNMFADALSTAYCTVAPVKLVLKYRSNRVLPHLLRSKRMI
jgi:predicted DNA-binding protein (MmcQ/YjbR family)